MIFKEIVESRREYEEFMKVLRLKQLFLCMLMVAVVFGTLPGGLILPTVSAAPDENGYAVTYDGNGADSGDVPVDPTLYSSGDLAVVHDNSKGLKKEGFIFNGWNTKQDGTGTDYLPGQTFAMGTENVTLYAKWIDPYTSWINRKVSSSQAMNAVAYMNGIFVGVGANGLIAATYDGTVWTKQMSGVAKELHDITGGGDRLIAVGADGTILISTDGEDWLPRSSGTTRTLRGVAYGNDMYVAAGDNGTIVVSRNGSHWIPVVSGTSGQLNAVTYADGGFVIVGNNGTVLTSTDGLQWTLQESGILFDLYSVAAGNGKVVAIGFLGTVLTSSDLVNWSFSLGGITGDVKDVTFTNGKFLVVGSGLMGGFIYESSNGGSWSQATTQLINARNGIAYGDGLYVSVGPLDIVTSNDGMNWSKYQSETFYGVNIVNGQYVALGKGVYSSNSGAVWKKLSDSTVILRDIAYGAGLYVVVGDNGTVLTSTNLYSWTEQESPTSNPLYGIVYSDGKFVAVGDFGTVIYSEDGTAWAEADSGDILDIRDVTYGNGLFVAVGHGVYGTYHGKAYWSADGVNWSRYTTVDVSLNGIAYGEDEYYAAGTGNNPNYQRYNLYYSANGNDWAYRSSGISGVTYNGIAYHDQTYVIVGTGGTIRVLKKGNTSWIPIATDVATTEFLSVAGGKATFLAVGTDGAVYQTRRTLPVSSTVHFDSNGGHTKATPAFMTLLPGDELGLLPEPPARTGYRFIGWNTEADGTGTAADGSFVVSADTVLYAQWKELFPPPAPTNLTSTAGAGEVILEWDAVTEADSYSVYKYQGEEAPTDPEDWELVVSDLTETTYTVTGLTNGTTYVFAVAAANEDGTGELSDPVADVPGGNGTEDHPYLIWNAQRLTEVGDDPEAYYALTKDIDLSYFGQWTPIAAFNGHLDGRGHTISGLWVKTNTASGLFDTIGSEGVVQNLVLEDVNVSLNFNFGNAGALAATLEGKASNVTVSGGFVSGSDTAGGLVGRAINGAVIVASCTDLTVSGIDYQTEVGGLVGYLDSATVDQSCSTGDTRTGEYVGGLVGLIHNAEINDSYSTSSVRGSSIVGGLVGGSTASSTLTNVFAAGKVVCTYFCDESIGGIGGLVGKKGNISFTSAYYDQGKTGQSDTGPESGIPLKHTDMAKEDSFDDWDFDEIWQLDDRRELPILLWQDDLAPVLSGAKVSDEAPGQVSVFFPEKMAAEEEALARFTVTVDGEEVQVTGAQLKGKELILTLASPILNRQDVEVAYADGEPPVTDKKGYRLASDSVTADNEVEPYIRIVALSPEDDADEVAVNTKLVLTFNDAVQATPGKYLYLMTGGGTVAARIGTTDPNVQIASEVVTITLPERLLSLKEYYVLIDADAFQYSATDLHGGIADPMTWNFVTAIDPEASWISIGEGFTAGKGSTPAMKAGTDGTLYVLFSDQSHSGKATVMKLGADETQWSVVGSAGFPSGKIGEGSLIVTDDKLYAAYGTGSTVQVMQYELDGEGDWMLAGDTLAADSSNVSDPYLLMHDGSLYVAYRDPTKKITVKKLTSSGTWETVGTESFSVDEIYHPSLAAVDGTLYAGFQDYLYEAGFGGTVMRFNPSSGEWELVGDRGFTSDFANDATLVADGNELYFVYKDEYYKPHAMSYDFRNLEWVKLGQTSFSSGKVYELAATADDGDLFVAYRDEKNSDRLTVKKYVDGEWKTIGSAGLTKYDAYAPSLVVVAGIPYVVFEDQSASGKLSAMKFATVQGDDEDEKQDSEITPTTATFDKYKESDDYQDIVVTVTLNGNTFESLWKGGTLLDQGTDYTLTVNEAAGTATVTILKSYLEEQKLGNLTLTFVFSDGEDQTLTITIKDTTPTQDDGGDWGQPGPIEQEPEEQEEPGHTETGPADNRVIVLVNGKEAQAGTVTTSTRNNQTVTTVIVDGDQLNEKLAEEGRNVVVTIPIPSGSDVAVGELNGQMVKNMEAHEAVLEIRTDRATYTIPAKQINIDAISDQVGGDVELQDIKVEVEIGEPTEATVRLVDDAEADGTFTLVVPPVEFTVRATYGDTTIEVTKFDVYVERTIAIPDGVDPEKITTGVVVDPDGTVRHVPTRIIVVDGRYYAVVSSLTNSTYTVIWNPREFGDVATHWAKETANNMGSRMIVAGTDEGLFHPDAAITRAEFATILVRALGLRPEQGTGIFTDVKETDWYSGAIHTAHAYGLLNGYTDGSFRPNEKITREQAMVIIARAMGITGLKGKLPAQSADVVLQAFGDADQASGWAIAGIADAVQAGIVHGRSTGSLAPQETISRAEAAAMIERLLQESGLI